MTTVKAIAPTLHLDEHDEVPMAVTAPPASYTSTQMPSRLRSLFNNNDNTIATVPPPSQPTAFTVPNDFDNTTDTQKGFKSNSWFLASLTGNKNKGIRRVASAPNAKMLQMQKHQHLYLHLQLVLSLYELYPTNSCPIQDQCLHYNNNKDVDFDARILQTASKSRTLKWDLQALLKSECLAKEMLARSTWLNKKEVIASSL